MMGEVVSYDERGKWTSEWHDNDETSLFTFFFFIY